MKVDLYPPKSRNTKILAFADVTVEEGIVVRGFRIIDGVNGVFVGIPSKPVTVNGEQRFWNQVAFTSPEVRERFLAELLEDYYRWTKKEPEPDSAPEGKTPVAENGGPPF
jgi:DNA-binding cell septation regulator SpoVG